MISQFRFVLIVFCFTAILISGVYLRNTNNHLSYKISVIDLEQSRAKQALWQKQLELESLINPAGLQERLK